MEEHVSKKKSLEGWEDNDFDTSYKTSMLQTLSQLLGTCEKGQKENTCQSLFKQQQQKRFHRRSTLSNFCLPQVIEVREFASKGRFLSEEKSQCRLPACSIRNRLQRVARLKQKLGQHTPKFLENSTVADLGEDAQQQDIASKLLDAIGRQQGMLPIQTLYRKYPELPSRKRALTRTIKLQGPQSASNLKPLKAVRKYLKKPEAPLLPSNEFGDMKLFRF